MTSATPCMGITLWMDAGPKMKRSGKYRDALVSFELSLNWRLQ